MTEAQKYFKALHSHNNNIHTNNRYRNACVRMKKQSKDFYLSKAEYYLMKGIYKEKEQWKYKQ